MAIDIEHNIYNKIPKTVKLQKGDRIRCKSYENLLVTMWKLNALGYDYRQQNIPFVIVITEVPENEKI